MTEAMIKINGETQMVSMAEIAESTFAEDVESLAIAPGLTKVPNGRYRLQCDEASFAALGEDAKLAFQIDVTISECLSRADGGDTSELVGKKHRPVLWGHNTDFETFARQVAYVAALYGAKTNGRKFPEVFADMVGSSIDVDITTNKKGFTNEDWNSAKPVSGLA